MRNIGCSIKLFIFPATKRPVIDVFTENVAFHFRGLIWKCNVIWRPIWIRAPRNVIIEWGENKVTLAWREPSSEFLPILSNYWRNNLESAEILSGLRKSVKTLAMLSKPSWFFFLFIGFCSRGDKEIALTVLIYQ